jgi:hypothetical protein
MSPAADSAGQPFEGRSFTPHPFQGDTGEEDPALAIARQGFDRVVSHPPGQGTLAELEAAWVGVIDALRSARLLSALVAEAGDFGVTETGARVEKTQELSVVHVEGPDGRVVAPFFSRVGAMTQWNPEARPIPVESTRAALATASDGLDLMVVDPGQDNSFVLRASAIKALATQGEYRPPWNDPDVHLAIARGIEVVGSLVVKHRVVAGDPSQTLSGPEVIVVVGVSPGLDPEQLRAHLAEISAYWAADEVLARGVDGVGVRVIPA